MSWNGSRTTLEDVLEADAARVLAAVRRLDADFRRRMSDTECPALAFLVAVGLLVTVHEFGHYWVARRLGFKVLRFSVGFGAAVVKSRARRQGIRHRRDSAGRLRQDAGRARGAG